MAKRTRATVVDDNNDDDSDDNDTRRSQSQEASLTAGEKPQQIDDEDDSAAVRAFNKRCRTDTRTNEEILEEQMQEWRASCYDHFHWPTIEVKRGIVRYIFRCKKHPSKTLARARHDSCTTNLNKHVARCAPAKEGTIEKFVPGAKYSKARMRFLLMQWVARRHRPYAIVEDEELRDIFRMLYESVEFPSAQTTSRDVREVFEIAKRNVIALLKAYPGKLHIGLDGWTSPNVFSFLGVVVYLLRDEEPVSLILDFVKLTKGHTGEILSDAVVRCLKDYGIDKKVLGVVCDNASNNDTMMESLESELESQLGVHTRIRCFAHILNLVVKAMLTPFTKGSRRGEEDDEDDKVGNADSDNSDGDDDTEFENGRERFDAMEVEDAMAEVSKEYHVSDAQANVARSSLTKLKRLATSLKRSPTHTADLEEACGLANIKSSKLTRSVETRWNSVAQASESAIKLKPALNKLWDMPQHSTRTSKLKRYKLSPVEWDILQQLHDILKHFLSATQRMSRSRIPLIHQVIPIFDILTSKINDAIKNPSLHIAVRAAAARGRVILDKYYSKTDESIMYRMAMMLHPRYKTAYFMKENWEKEWIDASTDILTEQWATYYRDSEGTVDPQDPISEDDDDDEDIFAKLDDQEIASKPTEIAAYIREDPVKDGFAKNPIKYWSSKGNDRAARMALDFLSAPATSVDVERAFSRGSLTVSKYRHSLSDRSTRAAIVLSSWLQVPGLVVEKEVISVFEEKASRHGQKGAALAKEGTSQEDSIEVD